MNPFTAIQHAVAARLSADPWLSDVPILTEDQDLVDKISQALGMGGLLGNAQGKGGVVILVITPDGVSRDENPTPVLKADITVRVVIAENPLVNRADGGIGKQALDLLAQVIGLLQGWASGPGQPPVGLSGFDSETDAQGTLTYYADFQFRRALRFTLQTPPPPPEP